MNIMQEGVNLPSPVFDDSLSRLLALQTSCGSLMRPEIFLRLHEAVEHTANEQIDMSPTLQVIAKREYDNPSGSHYDRAYANIINWLETNNYIKPGDELRDITSGSAGTSLALLGKVLGYTVAITVPPELPANRIIPMQIFGARINISQAGYVPAASTKQATEIKDLLRNGWKRVKIPNLDISSIILRNKDHTICYVNHSESILSPLAFTSIGREMVQDTSVSSDAVVLAIGNWTTIAGITPVIRQNWPSTRIVGYRDSRPEHDSFGTNVANVPLRFDDPDLLDDVFEITPDARDEMDAKINAGRPMLEQIGRSSLMGLCAAEEAAIKYGAQSVATIFYDQKIRY